ncbi:MAG: sel1 repeat family protein [Holosporales bacterium]|nr:sel1 repeat family protein [Holosporales bacterium]
MKRFILLCGLAMPCLASVDADVNANIPRINWHINSQLKYLSKAQSETLARDLFSQYMSTPTATLQWMYPLSNKKYLSLYIITKDGQLIPPLDIRSQILFCGLSNGDPHCVRIYDSIRERGRARSIREMETYPSIREMVQFQKDAARFYILNARKHPDYAFKSACCLLFGKGVPQCIRLGSHYLWRATLAGHPAAQYMFYAFINQNYDYCRNLPEFQFTPAFILRCLIQSANQGYAPAQNSYGSLLEKGGRFQDAAVYFRRSADNGDVYGQFNYGSCLASGRGVTIDPERAAYYFKRSADQGYSTAQCNYGVCLRYGIGVPINLRDAAHYLRLAANQDEPRAQCHYGHALSTGAGVEWDPERAAHYFQRSADQGLAIAQYTYGVALMLGYGVEQDIETAVNYLISSAAQEYEAAIEYLRRLDLL